MGARSEEADFAGFERRPPPGAGTVVAGRYRVMHDVGRGGMSHVACAEDLWESRQVAVKFLRRTARRAAERFDREARTLLRLKHPGVVEVFDYGEDPEHGLYLVMDLLEGEDLARVLSRRRLLRVAATLCIAEQACDALEFVHGQGIVHRDLKPSNLFLLDAGVDAPIVKVLDFGVARLLDELDELTAPGDLVGTLCYMAPEQWEDSSAVSPPADVYALGAVLYELLCGEPPFRELTRAGLKLAVSSGRHVPVCTARSDVPRHVGRAVDRALAKRPEERFQSMAAFAAALGVHQRRSTGSFFSGDSRFTVLSTLAVRGSTTVYAVLDRTTGEELVLKCVEDPTGEALRRMNREHRVASSIRDPNVVRARELFWVDRRLCLTLELVKGSSFDHWVGDSEPRLRRALSGLLAGLSVLHARALVHGDVKPTNVLVEDDGRAVLIDLGLSRPVGAEGEVVGTPGYLPEEAFDTPASPAQDMFAVGCMLRELLPRIPLEQRSALSDLCDRLSSDDPCIRPTAEQALATLGAELPKRNGPHRTSRATVFVGRKKELDVLRHAVGGIREGRSASVWIIGPTGIGKSALLDAFAIEARREHGALVLNARFREGATIPFPGIDSAIDALGDFLIQAPVPVVEGLLPRGAAALARVFPVLQRVPATARLPLSSTPADPVELRRVAFEAFRELIRRISDRVPVILSIDDSQWLDTDSLALLTHLLHGSSAPPLLLVGAVRDDAMCDVSTLAELRSEARAEYRELRLGPLDPASCADLIRAELGPEEDPSATESLTRRSEGVPFLLEVLIAHARTFADAREVSVEEALAETVRSLPSPSRRILEIVASCERPVLEYLLTAARGTSRDEFLGPLIEARLVRRTRTGIDWLVEPYHLGVRASVLSRMGPDEKVDLCAEMVECLRKTPERDPELLVQCLSGCGRSGEASKVALGAAALAVERLAFDRAAALYAIASRQPGLDQAERLALHRRHATALHNAGRRHAAAEVLIGCAASLDDSSTCRIVQREAAKHFLLSGNLEEGFAALEPTLERLGMKISTDIDESVLAAMKAFQTLFERGLGFEPRNGSIAPDELERIQVSLLLAQSLTHVDLRGVSFAFEALLAALDAGQPELVQLASAVFLINTVGNASHALVEPVLRLCRDLSKRMTDPYARAMQHLAEAEVAHFGADFLRAQVELEKAESMLLQSCVGATRELATVRNNLVFVEYSHKGDFKTLLDRTLGWLAEADVKQDRYHSCMLRVAHSIVWIAHDEPERASAMLSEAEDEWPGGAGALEVAAALYRDIIDRYLGDDSAHLHAGQGRASVLEGLAGQTPFLGGYLHLHRGWGALRALHRSRHGASERELVLSSIRALRAPGLPIWEGVADALESNLVYLDGRSDEAISLMESAEQTLTRLHMRCLAACARKRRGEIMGAEVGARLELEAEETLRSLGVQAPRRWARAYWSMFPADASALATLDGDVE